MAKRNGLYLKAPNGVKVQRHEVRVGNGESVQNRTYFTVNGTDNFRPLVAAAVGDKFFWVRNGFSS